MTTVYAYLDAGTGSMLLQIFLGGFAAAAVAAKIFWRRILHVLHIRRDDYAAPDHEPES